MKSIIFICPYFGKLPEEQMPLWLECCKYNNSIDWIVITDDKTKYDYPSNVVVKYISFEELKKRIQRKFDFELDIRSAYKLCDFKPAYGYIFSDEIDGYDYWGHCDMSDCIMGDLRSFLSDERLLRCDKIGFLGHMTVYLNTEEVNRRIFKNTKVAIPLNEILGSNENKAFDELNPSSINTIYQENGYDVERIDDIYYDISPLQYSFRQACYDEDYQLYYPYWKREIFEWNEGKLYRISQKNKNIKKQELGYVHFQKRKMTNSVHNKKHFLIVPNEFIDYQEFDEKFLKKKCRNRIYKKYFELKFEALEYYICKIYRGLYVRKKRNKTNDT